MQGPSGGKEEEEDAEGLEGDLETVAELGFDEQIINLVLEAGAFTVTISTALSLETMCG